MKVGITKVRVVRQEENGSKREIHRGIVVENKGSFVRVYNPAPQKDGGDASQSSAELFPIKSKYCWVEPMGELNAEESLALDACLR